MAAKKKLTRRRLAARVADSSGLPKSRCYGVINDVLEGIVEALAAGQKVELRDFGVFRTVVRKGRRIVVPGRRRRVKVPRRREVRFSAGKGMRERVNESGS